MSAAVFVLSTGRCGTQWLARFLGLNLGERATVTHEPIHAAWSPREMLGARDPGNLPPRLREPIDRHLQSIRDVLRGRTYVECGYPLWSAVPFLIETFAPVRIMHLVRHPVPTAWSWLTHRAFCPPLLPHIAEKTLLSPFDGGVQFPEYRRRWSAMSPFEKSLYYWLEVIAFELHLRAAGTTTWLTLTFDEMFGGEAQRRILEFVTASKFESGPESLGSIDEQHALTEQQVDPREIENHPAVMRVAAELGFDPLSFDVQRLRERYDARHACL